MSSREEEKRRRREERLAQEQRAASAAARAKVIRAAGAGLLSIASIAVIVVALSARGDSGSGPDPQAAKSEGLPIPSHRVKDLQASLKAAGCELKENPDEGQGHTTENVVYKTNPPTSGEHFPEAALDGVYSPGNSPTAERSVHALEHGRVMFQWRKGSTERVIGQLRTLFEEKDAYHVLLFENQTGMPYAVAASSWTRFVGCKTFSPKVFDALRNFRDTYTDKAPEQVP